MAYDMTNAQRQKLRNYLVQKGMSKDILESFSTKTTQEIMIIINEWKKNRLSIIEKQKAFYNSNISKLDEEKAELEAE